MWSWISPILFIALCIYLGPMKQVSGQDGFLRCDDRWISGIDVTLRCEVNKTSINNKCVTQQNSTFFKKDDVNQCAVLDNEYANCLPEGESDPTASCWCEQNTTFFIFMHKFKADRFNSKGVWTCQKACFDGGGFNNPLILSADSSCDSVVEESSCDNITCTLPSACALIRELNEAHCVCPLGYTLDECHQCGGFFDMREGCRRIARVLVIVVICLLVAALLIVPFLLFGCLLKRRTLDLPPGQDSLPIVESIRAECEKSFKEDYSTFSKTVNVGALDLGVKERLVMEGKNIISLNMIYQEAKEIIKKRVTRQT